MQKLNLKSLVMTLVALSTLMIMPSQTTAAPIQAGRWYATGGGVLAPTDYVWGTESFNTKPLCFSRSVDNKQIVFHKAGLYSVHVNVSTFGTPSGQRTSDVFINSSTRGALQADVETAGNTGHSFHVMTVVEQFAAGEAIDILLSGFPAANAMTYGFAGDPYRSSLSIVRLSRQTC